MQSYIIFAEKENRSTKRIWNKGIKVSKSGSFVRFKFFVGKS